MNDTVTNSDVGTELGRLARAHGKPYGVAVERQAEEYAAAFRRVGLPMVAVRAAVNEAIDLGKRFPSVAELIERARPHVPQTDGERNANPDACSQCGSGYFYAGYAFEAIAPRGHARYSRPAMVLPKLRCACPQSDPAWYTTEALAWEESEPEKFRGMRRPRDYTDSQRYRLQ